jgi:hypothetical protein
VVGGRRVCVCEAISGTRLRLVWTSTSLILEENGVRKEEVLNVKIVSIVERMSQMSMSNGRCRLRPLRLLRTEKAITVITKWPIIFLALAPLLVLSLEPRRRPWPG